MSKTIEAIEKNVEAVAEIVIRLRNCILRDCYRRASTQCGRSERGALVNPLDKLLTSANEE